MKPNNPWVTHVKKYAAEHNIAYGCAIANPDCKATYTKKVKSTKKEIDVNKKNIIKNQSFTKKKLTEKEIEENKRNIIENQSFTQIKNKIKEIDGDITKKMNVRMYFDSYNQSIKDKFKQKFPNNYNKLFG